MPPLLPRAPTPSTFANVWVEEVLKPALPLAAGKDKRLSAREAARAASVTEGPLGLAGETLEAIRTLTGQPRPGIAKLVEAGRQFAQTSAAAVAGSDGKVSLIDARKLAVGLEKGYRALRQTHTPPSPPEPPPAGVPDLGIVSDIDKTVLPPASGAALPAPYPGVATLFQELDKAADGTLDATHYVTARSPDRVTDLPQWLADHHLPSEGISTGVGSQPWIAEPEKVQDILQIMDAHPGQRYVLFGDTSHRDPEVYRTVRNQRPDQVAAIVIHKVNATVNPARVEGMSLVGNYAQAAATLHDAGLLSAASARKVISAARAAGLVMTDAEAAALVP